MLNPFLCMVQAVEAAPPVRWYAWVLRVRSSTLLICTRCIRYSYCMYFCPRVFTESFFYTCRCAWTVVIESDRRWNVICFIMIFIYWYMTVCHFAVLRQAQLCTKNGLMGSGNGIGNSICECKSRVKSCLGKQDVLPHKVPSSVVKGTKEIICFTLSMAWSSLFCNISYLWTNL